MDVYIDATLLVLLLGVGKLIKSSALFDKVQNKYITIILPILGILLELIVKKSVSIETITLGLYTGLAATGTHQIGKQLLLSDDDEEEDDTEFDDDNEDSL